MRDVLELANIEARLWSRMMEQLLNEGSIPLGMGNAAYPQLVGGLAQQMFGTPMRVYRAGASSPPGGWTNLNPDTATYDPGTVYDFAHNRVNGSGVFWVSLYVVFAANIACNAGVFKNGVAPSAGGVQGVGVAAAGYALATGIVSLGVTDNMSAYTNSGVGGTALALQDYWNVFSAIRLA